MSGVDYRLAAYAMDLLDAQELAKVEAEIKANPSLQQDLQETIAVMNTLSEAPSTMQPDISLRSRILQGTQPDDAFSGFTSRLTQFLDLDVVTVERILTQAQNANDPDWETNPLPGTQLLHFAGGSRTAQADCGLVKLEPGTHFPAHRHLGDEWAFVIQGEVLEDDGSRFLPGDISFRESGSQHGFTAVGRQPLILVVVLYEGFEVVNQT